MKPLTPSTPHVIIMVGIPGSGKSVFAEHFAKTFQAPLVNVDDIASIADIEPAASSIIAHKLLTELLKTGRTLIYEGSTDSRSARQALIKYITSAGYKPLLVWVQTETMEAKRRSLRKRAGRTPMSTEEFDQAVKRFTPPSGAEKAIVISGKHTYATQVKAVLKHLAGPRPERPNVDTPERRRSGRNILIR